MFGFQVFETCKYCKEDIVIDCWDSEEWSAKHGETASDPESMWMAEIDYCTSDSEADDEPLPYEADYVLNFDSFRQALHLKRSPRQT